LGWPNLRLREKRILLRIFFFHEQNKFWGLFARADGSMNVTGMNTPLVWVHITKNVVNPNYSLLFVFFLKQILYLYSV
jgi:hypothetical protein